MPSALSYIWGLCYCYARTSKSFSLFWRYYYSPRKMVENVWERQVLAPIIHNVSSLLQLFLASIKSRSRGSRAPPVFLCVLIHFMLLVEERRPILDKGSRGDPMCALPFFLLLFKENRFHSINLWTVSCHLKIQRPCEIPLFRVCVHAETA